MSEQAQGRRRWLGDFPLNRPGHSGLSGPIYPKILRLKHLHPSAWQRAALVEGSITVGAVAALADQVTAWTPVILPVAVAAVVKFHDVLTGILRPGPLPRAVQLAPTTAAPVAVAPVVVAPTLSPAAKPAAVPQPEPAQPKARLVTDVQAAGVTRARIRADFDRLSEAALDRALDELTRRGGLDTFVLVVGDGDSVSVVPLQYGLGGLTVDESVEATVANLAQPGAPTMRAVAVARDVSLPGKDRRDAIRLDLEHADGETEQVIATYRRTGIGGHAVVGELTRRSGRRSGVPGRVFGSRLGT